MARQMKWDKMPLTTPAATAKQKAETKTTHPLPVVGLGIWQRQYYITVARMQGKAHLGVSCRNIVETQYSSILLAVCLYYQSCIDIYYHYSPTHGRFQTIAEDWQRRCAGSFCKAIASMEQASKQISPIRRWDFPSWKHQGYTYLWAAVFRCRNRGCRWGNGAPEGIPRNLEK